METKKMLRAQVIRARAEREEALARALAAEAAHLHAERASRPHWARVADAEERGARLGDQLQEANARAARDAATIADLVTLFPEIGHRYAGDEVLNVEAIRNDAEDVRLAARVDRGRSLR